jgi:hypothetical protein
MSIFSKLFNINTDWVNYQNHAILRPKQNKTGSKELMSPLKSLSNATNARELTILQDILLKKVFLYKPLRIQGHLLKVKAKHNLSNLWTKMLKLQLPKKSKKFSRSHKSKNKFTIKNWTNFKQFSQINPQKFKILKWSPNYTTRLCKKKELSKQWKINIWL